MFQESFLNFNLYYILYIHGCVIYHKCNTYVWYNLRTNKSFCFPKSTYVLFQKRVVSDVFRSEHIFFQNHILFRSAPERKDYNIWFFKHHSFFFIIFYIICWFDDSVNSSCSCSRSSNDRTYSGPYATVMLSVPCICCRAR